MDEVIVASEWSARFAVILRAERFLWVEAQFSNCNARSQGELDDVVFGDTIREDIPTSTLSTLICRDGGSPSG